MSRHRLALLRHAKAQQGGRDRDRALTERGRVDAAAAGAWLLAHETVPDLVIVSPARRAVQTWEAVAEHLPATDVRYDDRVYDNHVDALLAAVADSAATAQTLLLVGHNPSIHALSVQLAGQHRGAHEALDAGFPTATVAVFDLDGDWADVDAANAHFVAVATCRAKGPTSD